MLTDLELGHLVLRMLRAVDAARHDPDVFHGVETTIAGHAPHVRAKATADLGAALREILQAGIMGPAQRPGPDVYRGGSAGP